MTLNMSEVDIKNVTIFLVKADLQGQDSNDRHTM